MLLMSFSLLLRLRTRRRIVLRSRDAVLVDAAGGKIRLGGCFSTRGALPELPERTYLSVSVSRSQSSDRN